MFQSFFFTFNSWSKFLNVTDRVVGFVRRRFFKVCFWLIRRWYHAIKLLPVGAFEIDNKMFKKWCYCHIVHLRLAFCFCCCVDCISVANNKPFSAHVSLAYLFNQHIHFMCVCICVGIWIHFDSLQLIHRSSGWFSVL